MAKDVAEALEYRWNGNAAIAHVPAEWRGVRSILTPGGTQELATLSEQGLYFFIARSDKPRAIPFLKWIAGEVLPAIRKTGQYSIRNGFNWSARRPAGMKSGFTMALSWIFGGKPLRPDR